VLPQPQELELVSGNRFSDGEADRKDALPKGVRFVRCDGLEIGRPSWAELEGWERELAAELARGREGA